MLSGRYNGKPVPSVAWTKNGEELKADEDIGLFSSTSTFSLNINKAKRDHSGRYCVNIENAAGTRLGICNITVVGESWCHSQFTHSVVLKSWKKVICNAKNMMKIRK